MNLKKNFNEKLTNLIIINTLIDHFYLIKDL
jgi:hypothetical protein